MGAALLEPGPPVGQLRVGLAGRGAQEQEVVSGTQARVAKQPMGSGPLALLQARLHLPDLAHRQREPLGDGHPRLLASGDLAPGEDHRLDGFASAVQELLVALAHGLPEQHGEQEGRGYRLVLRDARIRVGQSAGDEGDREVVLLAGQAVLGVGEEVAEEAVVAQLLEGIEPEPGLEEFEELVEESGGGDVV